MTATAVVSRPVPEVALASSEPTRGLRPLVIEASNASLAGPLHGGLRVRLIEAIEAWTPVVLLDVRRATWADARGLGLLVAIRRRALSRGSRFVVVGACEELRTLLELTRLDTLIEQASTVGECLGAATHVLYAGGVW